MRGRGIVVFFFCPSTFCTFYLISDFGCFCMDLLLIDALPVSPFSVRVFFCFNV